MMRAYDEMYLNDAMKNLGEAFDYSATVLNIPMDDFLDQKYFTHTRTSVMSQ